MLKKRIIGGIIVRRNIAVQSFNYKSYLPLGRPEILAENLDNWGVDEIVLTVIDRGNRGPDFELLEKLKEYKISTPLIYGGGIKTEEQASRVIGYGVERIILDSIIYEDIDNVEKIHNALGSQALVFSLPLVRNKSEIKFYNYKKGNFQFNEKKIREILNKKQFSEIVLINVNGEGGSDGFDKLLFDYMSNITKIPFILFGGICKTKHISDCLSLENVSAVMVGNSLNYKENNIYRIKKEIKNTFIRKHNLI
tara:strand:- start:1701 stop:2456 length:756 start_codon:yes stop_codon:yes gene_type:complete